MADALRAARVAPAFRAALRLHLVETSEPLRRRQRDALAQGGVPISWHMRFEDVPRGPTIAVANEFFDALPIRQYLRAERGWHERLVGLGAQGALSLGLSAQIEPSIRLPAPVGAILEISPDALALAHAIGERLVAHGGAALVIDYGHAKPGFGDTLQAVRRHGFADPLASPGENDLTAHVDFAALGEAARGSGAAVRGPVMQGDFLRSLGVEARARALQESATPSKATGIATALARLTGDGDGEMGTLFKVMAIADPRLGDLAGFAAPADDLRGPPDPR